MNSTINYYFLVKIPQLIIIKRVLSTFRLKKPGPVIRTRVQPKSARRLPSWTSNYSAHVINMHLQRWVLRTLIQQGGRNKNNLSHALSSLCLSQNLAFLPRKISGYIQLTRGGSQADLFSNGTRTWSCPCKLTTADVWSGSILEGKLTTWPKKTIQTFFTYIQVKYIKAMDHHHINILPIRPHQYHKQWSHPLKS
jgi:hypothetical protein